MFLFINAKINSKVMLYLAIHCGYEHIHTSKKEPHLLYIVGVRTPTLSKRKPYVPYVMGVGSSILYQEAESFSYMSYIVGVATSISSLIPSIP